MKPQQQEFPPFTGNSRRRAVHSSTSRSRRKKKQSRSREGSETQSQREYAPVEVIEGTPTKATMPPLYHPVIDPDPFYEQEREAAGPRSGRQEVSAKHSSQPPKKQSKVPYYLRSTMKGDKFKHGQLLGHHKLTSPKSATPHSSASLHKRGRSLKDGMAFPKTKPKLKYKPIPTEESVSPDDTQPLGLFLPDAKYLPPQTNEPPLPSSFGVESQGYPTFRQPDSPSKGTPSFSAGQPKKRQVQFVRGPSLDGSQPAHSARTPRGENKLNKKGLSKSGKRKHRSSSQGGSDKKNPGQALGKVAMNPEQSKHEKAREYAKAVQQKYKAALLKKEEILRQSGSQQQNMLVSKSAKNLHKLRDFSPLTGITQMCLSGFSDLTEINEILELEEGSSKSRENSLVFTVTKVKKDPSMIKARTPSDNIDKSGQAKSRKDHLAASEEQRKSRSIIKMIPPGALKKKGRAHAVLQPSNQVLDAQKIESGTIPVMGPNLMPSDPSISDYSLPVTPTQVVVQSKLPQPPSSQPQHHPNPMVSPRPQSPSASKSDRKPAPFTAFLNQYQKTAPIFSRQENVHDLKQIEDECNLILSTLNQSDILSTNKTNREQAMKQQSWEVTSNSGKSKTVNKGIQTSFIGKEGQQTSSNEENKATPTQGGPMSPPVMSATDLSRLKSRAGPFFPPPIKSTTPKRPAASSSSSSLLQKMIDADSQFFDSESTFQLDFLKDQEVKVDLMKESPKQPQSSSSIKKSTTPAMGSPRSPRPSAIPKAKKAFGKKGKKSAKTMKLVSQKKLKQAKVDKVDKVERNKDIMGPSEILTLQAAASSPTGTALPSRQMPLPGPPHRGSPPSSPPTKAAFTPNLSSYPSSMPGSLPDTPPPVRNVTSPRQIQAMYSGPKIESSSPSKAQHPPTVRPSDHLQFFKDDEAISFEELSSIQSKMEGPKELHSLTSLGEMAEGPINYEEHQNHQMTAESYMKGNGGINQDLVSEINLSESGLISALVQIQTPVKGDVSIGKPQEDPFVEPFEGAAASRAQIEEDKEDGLYLVPPSRQARIENRLQNTLTEVPEHQREDDSDDSISDYSDKPDSYHEELRIRGENYNTDVDSCEADYANEEREQIESRLNTREERKMKKNARKKAKKAAEVKAEKAAAVEKAAEMAVEVVIKKVEEEKPVDLARENPVGKPVKKPFEKPIEEPIEKPAENDQMAIEESKESASKRDSKADRPSIPEETYHESPLKMAKPPSLTLETTEDAQDIITQDFSDADSIMNEFRKESPLKGVQKILPQAMMPSNLNRKPKMSGESSKISVFLRNAPAIGSSPQTERMKPTLHDLFKKSN